MSRDWSQTGANAGAAVINAGAGFATGLFGAVKGVGNRIQRGKHAAFIETFCAVLGDVASQNGQYKDEEVAGIRRFLLENHSVAALAAYDVDELAEKIKQYAVASFTGDRETIVRAVQGLDRGGDTAKLVIIAALAVAFADGDCDQDEANCISNYANQLGVNLQQLGQECQLQIPNLGGAGALPSPASQPAVVTQSPPAQSTPTTASKPCGMCDGSGKRNGVDCPFCQGSGQRK